MILESGNYLKSEDAKAGDMVTFKDEGAWVENTKYTYDDGKPRQDFVIGVSHNGTDKKMRLNKTNRDAMVASFGKDTAVWINNSARITKQSVMVAGKLMDCIFLEVGPSENTAKAGEEQVPF